MRKGKNLVELAREVQSMADSRRDFIVNTDAIKVASPDTLLFSRGGEYSMGTVFHEQLASKLSIPKPYYDRMKEQEPDLYVASVNTWMSRESTNRMVRTVGGTARAYLSDRYRPLDNDMILETVLPVFSMYPGLTLASSEVTERRMYVQCVYPKLQAEVVKGDIVQAGIVVSNSEVGLGSVSISPMIYRLVCMNGMIRGFSLRKYHIGKAIEENELFFESDTIMADNKAFLLRVRDTVNAALSDIAFNNEVGKLQEAAGMAIKKPIDTVIAEVTKRFNMPVASRDSILKNLIVGGDLSKWGLANAITSLAHNEQDYDKSFEMEVIGGRIVDLSRSEWTVLAA